MIEFECPNCGSTLRVEQDHAGRHAWCRRCKRVAIVPSGTAIPTMPAWIQGYAPAGPPLNYRATMSSQERAPHAGETQVEGLLATAEADERDPETTSLLRRDVQAFQVELAERSARVDQLTAELAAVRQAKNDDDAEVARLKTDLRTTREKLDESAEAVAERDRAMAQQLSELKTYKALIQEKDDRLNALMEELAAVEIGVADTASLTSALQEAQASAEKYERLYLEAQAAEGVRESEVADGQRALRGKDEQIRRLSEDLSELQEQLAETERRTAESLAKLDISGEQAEALARVQAELESSRARLRQKEEENRTFRTDTERLEAQLAEQAVETARVSNVLAQALQRETDQEQDLDRMSGELQRVRDECTKAEGSFRALQSEVDSLKDEGKTLRQTVAERDATVAGLRESLTAAEDALTAAEEAKRDLEHESREIQSLLNEERKEGEQVRAAEAELREKAEGAESDLDRLNAQHQEAKAAKDDAERERAEVRRELSDAHAEIERLKEKLDQAAAIAHAMTRDAAPLERGEVFEKADAEASVIPEVVGEDDESDQTMMVDALLRFLDKGGER